jgi:hypothetical protein
MSTTPESRDQFNAVRYPLSVKSGNQTDRLLIARVNRLPDSLVGSKHEQRRW